MTYDPNDPNRPYEYPSLESSPAPVDPYAPLDYPSTYPTAQSPSYPPPQPFPPPYQGYGGDPYDPYRAARPPGTNGMAITALVMGLIGVPLCACGVPSIVALVLGILAMNETKRTGQEGHGMALAAVIIAGVSLALGIVLIIISAVVPDESS